MRSMCNTYESTNEESRFYRRYNTRNRTYKQKNRMRYRQS